MNRWIRNCITFTGDDSEISNLMESIKELNPQESLDSYLIDFRKILPPPDDSYFKEYDTDFDYESLYSDFGSNVGYQEQGYSIPTKYQSVDEYMSMVKKHKFYTLNDWKIDNWGTKSNATLSAREGNKIYFSTEKSTPLYVIQELSYKFPQVEMKVEFSSGEFKEYVGVYILKAGELIHQNEHLDCIRACEIWSCDPWDYFPEIVRERKLKELLGIE